MLEAPRFWDAEITANLAGKVVIDLGVPRNSTAIAESRIVPPRMATALTEKPAAIGCHVLKKVAAFHTAIGNSSNPCPAAPRASARLNSMASAKVIRRDSSSSSRVAS